MQARHQIKAIGNQHDEQHLNIRRKLNSLTGENEQRDQRDCTVKKSYDCVEVISDASVDNAVS